MAGCTLRIVPARTGSTPMPASPGNERHAPLECRDGPRRVNGISQKMASPRAPPYNRALALSIGLCSEWIIGRQVSSRPMQRMCNFLGQLFGATSRPIYRFCATPTQLSGQNGLPSRQPAATATAASPTGRTRGRGSAHATSAAAIHCLELAVSGERPRNTAKVLDVALPRWSPWVPDCGSSCLRSCAGVTG